MNQLPQALQITYTVLLIIGWLAAAVFPVVYGLTMRFWESELGMHFWSYGVAVWLALTPGFIIVVFGDFPGRGIVNLITFTLVVFVIIWRDIIFLRILFKKERHFTPSNPEKE